ncbi:MAG: leucine-rich repeat domain-containing protein [Treponema sp.]|nr:leucine-rich repeat domain-containing protein [Treponema sp.]
MDESVSKNEPKIDAFKRKKIAEIRTAGTDALLSMFFEKHKAKPLFRNEGYKKVELLFAWENGDLAKVTLYKAWTSEWIPTFPLFLSKVDEGVSPDEAVSFAHSLGLKAEKASLLTVIKGAVEKCDIRAERIAVPDGIVALGNRAFRSCKSLLSVTIPKSVRAVSSITFDGCNSLMEISVDEENPSYKTENGLLMTKDGKTVVRCPQRLTGKVIIPDGVELIERKAFAETGISEVVIPRSCKTIRNESFIRSSTLKSAKFLGTEDEWDEVQRDDLWNYMSGIDFVECTDGMGMC